MRSATALILPIILLALAGAAPETQPLRSFKLIQVFEVSDDAGRAVSTIKLTTLFVGEKGVQLDEADEPKILMDFSRQTFQKLGENERTLKEMSTTAQERRQKMVGSLDDLVDAEIARRLNFELSPQFAIDAKGSRIVFDSNVWIYEVDTQPADQWTSDRILESARLTEYSNALLLNPPYARLQVFEELHRRGVVARAMKMTGPLVGGTRLVMNVKASIETISVKEEHDIAIVLEQFKTSMSPAGK